MNDANATPLDKLQELLRLAEKCVELLRENNEFYAEVRSLFILSLRLFYFPLHT